MGAFFNHLGRQRNITGDYKITNTEPFNDLIVSNVKAGRYLNKFYAARRRYVHRMIGQKRQLHPGTLGRSKQNILDHHRARICIYPYFHFMALLFNTSTSQQH